MFDFKVVGARIIDGTGNPWYRAQVGVLRGCIAAVGDLRHSSSRAIVDAHDRYLAPGFIDPHTHSDFTLFASPRGANLVSQGITTEVVGNCGLSPHPVNDHSRELLLSYSDFLACGLDWGWHTTKDYLDRLERLPLSHNVVCLVGHGSVRIAVMGFDDRPPTTHELETMSSLVSDAMNAGAVGVSSGLVYAPGSYAATAELVELCRTAARHGGLYATHLRSEADGFIQAVDEALAIGREAGLPVQLSHHKVIGEANWGQVNETLSMVDRARADGLDVTLDQYPYTGSSTTVAVFLPNYCLEGGVDRLALRLSDPLMRERIIRDLERQNVDWTRVRVTGLSTLAAAGDSIADIASERGVPPTVCLVDLIEREGRPFRITRFGVSERDLRTVMQHETVMIGSDGAAMEFTDDRPHPRNYGTFPRALGHYARREGVVCLEQMVRKMTSLPAQRFGLVDRGLLRPGMMADMVLFSDEIIDTASFEEPHAIARGVDAVWVSGSLVWNGASDTGAAPGRVLKPLLEGDPR